MPVSTDDALATAAVRLDAASHRIKKWTALTVMTLPALGFAAALWMLATGRFAATDLWLLGVMYALHMFGITIGFHRYLAHKAFKTPPAVEAVLLVCGSMAAQGPILFWVSTHRRHHRFSDREGDPHSPNLHGASLPDRLNGLWWAHMPWMLSPESSRWSVFAPDLLRSRRLYFYHRTYGYWVLAGLLGPALVGLAVERSLYAAVSGLVFGGLARMFLANQAAWCVGSICHRYGGRPFYNRDLSANNWPVAILTFGEGLQNNHHAFPSAYRHGVRWWEPDLSGWVLTAMGKARLVHDLRMPDKAAIARRRAVKGS